ncbi:extracellular catalytic domain type 1 short-chain-length polyhydroxyalkanoate depolymerase [Singulisphaera acidiphila]|uniref:Poly(3-hydroxybutyrate) depolymerase n=1 Tax=Singulisphaera acidiphila (strain ATCC BAA-1392 / DSM 18658 / VKM B-2454 / MOB10) TaxID=886293 RepID=L0DCF0_SINAD|nr:PHB depolymerase family esterase [Singulisphaera acidiphila]AGA26545.1 poly(3-hydroxybutyrate) depolymerase [Singulisphaera acidiphila DSM 18658]
MVPLLALTLVITQISALEPGDSTRTITVGDLERSYLVHVPKSYDGSKPVPVVLVFHGGGSNAGQWVRFCGLNETADKAGFIAVYPNGTGKKIEGYPEDVLTWNGGRRQPGGNDALLQKVDDVSFTRELLDDLAKVAKVDAQRVYATGMSMGAIMTYRLASELSDRIAAIAPVCGPMGTETCRPKRPVSVIHFHGTEDEAVPLKGGKGKLDVSGTDFYSVDHSIRAWVKANGCHEKPTTDELPDRVDDGTKVIRKTYSGGEDGSQVVLVVIEGGGHTWPGREFGPELKVLGKSTKDVAANALIWEFFENHPMKPSTTQRASKQPTTNLP